MELKKIEYSDPDQLQGKFGRAEKGIVVTAFDEATRAGVEMLERGGNAVDAACAASMALCVCEPQSSGLGGQGMAIVHINGKTIALDGSSRIPSLTHISNIQGHEQSLGYKAATVPSIPALIGYLHLQYGRLNWAEILEPAIHIAMDGYRISPLQRRHQEESLSSFLLPEGQAAARYFLKDGASPYDVGDIFIQKDLGQLLSILATEGPRSFYLGKIAQQIDEDMRANGGFIRAEDLAFIPWPVERKPMRRNYRDVNICTIPPPAAGRDLMLVLQMLNHVDPAFISELTPHSAHVLAETFRRSLLQRHQHPVRPALYNQAEDRTLGSASFAAKLIKSIRSTIDPDLPLHEPRSFGNHTTHLSVMDDEGNAVGLSQSIESVYGSRTAADGLGFLYNNYVTAMETKDPGHPYYLRPNVVPWSSVAPTILFHNDEPWMTLGSPGSERIFSTMTQFIIHIIDGNKSMVDAVKLPRLHCSMGGEVSLEADRFSPEIVSHFEQLGYRVDKRGPYSHYLGAIYAAMRCQSKKEFQGIAEVRREGSVAGPA